jgi:selenocysteine lyase/cysteine desulfurase
VSNVTGIVNPIRELAKLAHRHGALLVVDAAQMAAHLPMHMSGHEDPAEDIDVLVFSGHKIYAPGSPGVVITRTELFEGLEPQEVGGGMVDDVYLNRYELTDKFPDREEAGTPNISGAIGLAASLYALDKVGMDLIAQDERELIEYAIDRLHEVPGIIIYGEPDWSQCERAGAVSFNLRELEHGLTAALLNDYFNVSVRNECFCAHPYVREMITEVLSNESDDLSDEEIERLADLHRGMVRASFGIYSTKADVDLLVRGLKDIQSRLEHYAPLYERKESGDYVHRTFAFDHQRLFSVKGAVDEWFAKAEKR